MTSSARKMEEGWIPSVSDDRLQELAERIRPVKEFRGVRRFIVVDHPKRTPLTLNPIPGDEATGLKPIGEIITYHTFANKIFFRPTAAEVIAQIPDELVDQVVAFEFVDSLLSFDHLTKDKRAYKAGYHSATTRLYGREEPATP